MKFGTSQLGKPTPQRIVQLFDFLTVFLGIVAGFLTAAEFVNHKFSDPATVTINLLLIPTCQAVKRMFGSDVHGMSTVPIEDVKAIEEHEPDKKE